MTDDKEPLSSRVKALEVVSRIGGLGATELVPAGSGQYFKLEINLGAGQKSLVIENVGGEVIEGDVVEESTRRVLSAVGHYSRSKLWDGIEREEL